jgi:hypothetical protein
MAGYPELSEHLVNTACLCGLTPETQVIAPGDGGPGVKEELEHPCPKVQYILDHRHLEAPLYETADALGIDPACQKS